MRATKNLVDGMLAASPTPATLVSQAAIGYYGDRGDAIVDESTPPPQGFLPQIVVEWENEALKAERGGVRVVIFRTGLILDPEGGLLKQLLLPFKLGVGGPLAGGDQYMPWIHLDDEVGLILWALDNAQVSGVLNATAPNPVTNREFSKALGRALHRPAVVPGAAAGRGRAARPRARRADRRQLPGDSAAGARPRLSLPLRRARRGAARPARLQLAAGRLRRRRRRERASRNP